MKHGKVTHQQVKWTVDLLTDLANGEPVRLEFGDQATDSTMGDVAAMIIRELASEEQLGAFLRRHGVSVTR